MSVSGITSLAASLGSTGSTPVQSPLKEYIKERNADLAQLNKYVQEGNLSAAEQEYQTMVALGQQDIHRDNPYFRADRATDFNAIGVALQSGDLTGAAQALQALYNTYPKRVDSEASSGSASGSSTPSGRVNVVG